MTDNPRAAPSRNGLHIRYMQAATSSRGITVMITAKFVGIYAK
jgi:hypothetical protein